MSDRAKVLQQKCREGFLFFKLGIVGMRKTENQEVDEEAFGRSTKAEKLPKAAKHHHLSVWE